VICVASNCFVALFGSCDATLMFEFINATKTNDCFLNFFFRTSWFQRLMTSVSQLPAVFVQNTRNKKQETNTFFRISFFQVTAKTPGTFCQNSPTWMAMKRVDRICI